MLLREKDTWTTDEVRFLILEEFDVEYTLKQVRVIAKNFGMKYAKPSIFDYCKPPNAKMILKNLPRIDENTIVGFLDETSPQTTANTQRLLSFRKPIIYRNITKYKANAFGFYALNGVSVIDFKEHSKKEDVCWGGSGKDPNSTREQDSQRSLLVTRQAFFRGHRYFREVGMHILRGLLDGRSIDEIIEGISSGDPVARVIKSSTNMAIISFIVSFPEPPP